MRIGMGGPVFDWLRMLYRRMEYYDLQSPEFKAFIGLLTGDTALGSHLVEFIHG
jgi:hypothetical protein